MQPTRNAEARWQRFRRLVTAIPPETSNQVETLVRAGQEARALKVLDEHQRFGISLSAVTSSVGGGVGGSKQERQVAEFLARLAIEGTSGPLLLASQRMDLCGQPEVMTTERALALLRDAPPGAPVHDWPAARTLMNLFGWSELQALMWILTEVPPPAIWWETHRVGKRSWIKLTAMPHVSTTSVSVAYSAARRRLLGGRRGPLPVKRGPMAEWVSLQRWDEGVSWEARCEAWNAVAPGGWHYADWRLMWRDCQVEKAARRRLGSMTSPHDVARAPAPSRARVLRPRKISGGSGRRSKR